MIQSVDGVLYNIKTFSFMEYCCFHSFHRLFRRVGAEAPTILPSGVIYLWHCHSTSPLATRHYDSLRGILFALSHYITLLRLVISNTSPRFNARCHHPMSAHAAGPFRAFHDNLGSHFILGMRTLSTCGTIHSIILFNPVIRK
jgi:hypothetical protein